MELPEEIEEVFLSEKCQQELKHYFDNILDDVYCQSRQLGNYDDMETIENAMTTMTGINGELYIVSRAKEEVEFEVVGYLSKKCLPPIKFAQDREIYKPELLRQMVTIVAPGDAFLRALTARQTLYRFMEEWSPHGSFVPFVPATAEGMNVFQASAFLLTARKVADQPGNGDRLDKIPWNIDDHGFIARMVRQGRFPLVRDNHVFQPGLFRRGHLVRATVTFRGVKTRAGKYYFASVLRSLTLLSRSGSHVIHALRADRASMSGGTVQSPTLFRPMKRAIPEDAIDICEATRQKFARLAVEKDEDMPDDAMKVDTSPLGILNAQNSAFPENRNGFST
ncbi:hypothetical protein BV25DRAFT_1836671 [Artomyces pyxidatus]|uniref:Uncharacterized protein n=1 Tax=Artomyces pyxidatus TaxID=48021 RepID=A0ACB8T7S6_9AGAM|nr:hypothetical protein BV25DRAFT_1836671 [Artomyces pyxidatus]